MTIANVESGGITGGSGNDTLTMTAQQLWQLRTVNLGDGTSDVLNVTVSGTGIDISTLGTLAISNVEVGNITGGDSTPDSITLTGAQLDAIIGGSAAAGNVSGTINLGSGAGDVILLKSTSDDLNALGPRTTTQFRASTRSTRSTPAPPRA
jgi:hypothetical protein